MKSNRYGSFSLCDRRVCILRPGGPVLQGPPSRHSFLVTLSFSWVQFHGKKRTSKPTCNSSNPIRFSLLCIIVNLMILKRVVRTVSFLSLQFMWDFKRLPDGMKILKLKWEHVGVMPFIFLCTWY